MSANFYLSSHANNHLHPHAALLMARVDDLRHASELELAWVEIWSASSECTPFGLFLPDTIRNGKEPREGVLTSALNDPVPTYSYAKDMQTPRPPATSPRDRDRLLSPVLPPQRLLRHGPRPRRRDVLLPRGESRRDSGTRQDGRVRGQDGLQR